MHIQFFQTNPNRSIVPLRSFLTKNSSLLSRSPRIAAALKPSSNLKMDWHGQKLAEQLMQMLLLVFAVVAFLAGYVLGSFQIMLIIYGGGVLLTSLITVPNWPFFNRHPLNWLDPSEAEKHPKPQSVNTTSKKKTGKK